LTAKDQKMKRLILTAAAAMMFAAMFGFTTNADAAPHKGGGHVVAHSHALVVHGHSIHVPVHVRGYHGWASRCWFPGYRCYGYYCGDDQAWYYWYAPFNEYLPITYMSIYPPTQMSAPVAVVPSAPVTMTPGLPSGATLVPGPITAP
jgi:hypothetical protein